MIVCSSDLSVIMTIRTSDVSHHGEETLASYSVILHISMLYLERITLHVAPTLVCRSTLVWK